MKNPLRKGDKVVLWGIIPNGEHEYELQTNRELISEWISNTGASLVHEIVDASAPGTPEDKRTKELVFAIGREHGACIIGYGTEEHEFMFLSNKNFWRRRGKNGWK